RAHLPVLPEMDLGIDDQHGRLPPGPQLTSTPYTTGGSAPNFQEDIVTKIITPPQPAPVMDIARELLPPGMELVVVDPGKPEFYGNRLGIVGLGNIGKKVARRVQGFDMDVRYFDILRLTEDQEDALGVRFALFTELLRTCDIVTLHVPLNDVTRKMISTRELAMMKKTAILINTCRGPVVDEDALHKALTSGTIAAAGLDVMVEEPPK